jgi:hypothetical protein
LRAFKVSAVRFQHLLEDPSSASPDTMGTVRRPDRALAAQLYLRGISAEAAPLGTIRSLACSLPVIEEVLGIRVSPDYFHYLRGKLERVGLIP